MQTKRRKRSRIRAAKRTAGHGSKKKNRGSGHRGGFGQSNIGKRGSAKIQKVTGSGGNIHLGKHGFKSLVKKTRAINLQELQNRLTTFLANGLVTKEGETYSVDLEKLGFEKLLSKGVVSLKMAIKTKYASQNAVEKVKTAGGSVEAEQVTEEVK